MQEKKPSNLQILYRHYKSSSLILKQILKYPITKEEGRERLKKRLAEREDNFLRTIEKAVFANPRSPYKVLLDRAGYSLDKVKALVKAKGIEEALKDLYRDGVYTDILEFKGKKEVRRGKDTYRFQERDFANPLLTGGLGTQSGATRSAGTKMIVPLEFIQQHNPYSIVGASECGMLENPSIIWLPILPAGEGLFFTLRFASMGNPPVKWFSQVDKKYIKPPTIEKLKTTMSVWMGRLYGKRIPKPEFVDLKDTVRIARWMHNNLKGRKGYSVVTYASSALRLIMAAKQENLNLGRTLFWLMGEPITPKIFEEIKDFGCMAYSLYGCNEVMMIGHGCANPAYPDDMHFLKDKLAVVQFPRKVEHSDITVDAFYFTTLLESSPRVFINTELGDYGIVERRSCGCDFEKIGFDWHIHTIRSFEKLTAEGATFIGTDLIPLIQETLPQRFGGDATSYQVLEESDETGIPRLYFLVSPAIGNIDEGKLREVIAEGLTKGTYSHDYSRAFWAQADTIQIKREYPIPTVRGKIAPLQIRRKISEKIVR